MDITRSFMEFISFFIFNNFTFRSEQKEKKLRICLNTMTLFGNYF